ncbi:uncharacterized protein LOC115447648 [Manduca sexta]|uniref:CHK kinase-like domain-containing protein n=1 Tax=Manduca sexta TaxID=7130 RepID=A0A922CSD2_MANSE|nr:uncharacterized protein LOC115447648 [Manduca sexta]KAG6456622.1 hypothetical protein O3G_MSEX009834 [Manduca sexta]
MPVRKKSCSQDFVDLIYKIADIFNLNHIQYVVEFGTEDVDSFYSGLYKVQIRGYSGGQKIKQTVVIKWHPDQKLRVYYRESYKREYVVYRNLVPKFLEIQRDFKIIEGLKIKFPNCIFASTDVDKETIAIVGLQESGFRFHDRFHKLDFAHASLVMKYLAKFHALSFILAKKYPREFEEIRNLFHKDVQYCDPSHVSKNLEFYYDASVNVVSDPVAKEKLKALGSDILSVLNKCTLPVPRYSTFCHADCWNNNVLYKYKGNRPVDTILIDYQLARYASPVTDISYFLYMSTDKEFLNNYYDQILEVYYGTLAAMLRQCDLDVNEVFPRNIFQKHLKEYSVLGLIEALVAMMIITAPNDDAIKMAEMIHQRNHDSIECENKHHYEDALFVERVNGVVNNFFDRNYSLDSVLNNKVV